MLEEGTGNGAYMSVQSTMLEVAKVIHWDRLFWADWLLLCLAVLKLYKKCNLTVK